MNLTKYFSIFKKEQKKGLLILFFFMTISALLEMLVLGMILPLIGVFIKDQATLSSNFILSISNLLNLETNNLILAIITIFILLFLIKIIFQLFYYWYESKFIYNFKQEITHTLFYTLKYYTPSTWRIETFIRFYPYTISWYPFILNTTCKICNILNCCVGRI